jgi:transposase
MVSKGWIISKNYMFEGSFLYSRTRHEIKRLEQQQKCIFEYRLFAFEYKYYIVSITFLIHYKNINLVCLQNAFQQPL